MRIPNLKKSEFGYEGTLEVNPWPDLIIEKEGDNNRVIDVATGGDMVEETPSLKSSHTAAYNYFIENQAIIKNEILKHLFTEYKQLQEEYGFDDSEKLDYMPNIKTIKELKNLIQLSVVHLLNIEKDDVAYTGFQFDCLWDPEHGLGFMTHKDRIIQMGGADTSFLTWIADQDLNPNEDMDSQMESNNELQSETSLSTKKKWWRFW
jgi:hypothetical protein